MRKQKKHKRAENVIIIVGHGNSGGFGSWWDPLMVALISSIAGFSVGIGLIQYFR